MIVMGSNSQNKIGIYESILTQRNEWTRESSSLQGKWMNSFISTNECSRNDWIIKIISGDHYNNYCMQKSSRDAKICG